MKSHFYITTTLPYVNADPHIGFALEIVRADTLARYNRLLGHEVFFNTGTDEHGMKIYQKACEAEQEPQVYVDEFASRFGKLKAALNLSYDAFIRTTDPYHKKAAQAFWQRCKENGDIYKKNYSVKYCVGCELEKTDSELEHGRCPLHPKTALELIEEENYFFRWSAYEDKLLKLYEETPDFVVPDFRLNEIREFVKRGLSDFSISRLKSKMPWGVPVPDDDDHVMYVWFDALVNYISTIGWPDDMATFEKWWPGVQIAGKDNLRQQSAMWQAMLMSAGLAPSKQIIINGFITSGGQKMSKSIGNVVNPFTVVDIYGTDAFRYFLLRHIHAFEDSDYTDERFKEMYNANLANGIGNLLSRIMKMAVSYEIAWESVETPGFTEVVTREQYQAYRENMSQFRLDFAMDALWETVSELDAEIQGSKPFQTIKEDPAQAKSDVAYLVGRLWEIAVLLEPCLPETAQTIQTAITKRTMPEALFMRKE